MSEIKNRDRILEAIDQLRRRKARPDAERICNFLSRRFAVDSQDTIADLERLVEEDIVIKVEYKGNISYRNAAKWSRYAMYNKNKEEGFTGTIYGSLNSEGTSSLLSSAIAELIISEPDYLDFGVPGHELEKYMQQKDSTRYNKRYLEVILQRELNSGNIVKLENGNYSLADHPVPSNPNINNNNNNSSNNETIKMLKIDSPNSQNMPEEEHNISRSQLSTLNSSTQKSDVNNKKGNNIYESKRNMPATAGSASASTEGFRDGAKRKRSKKVFFDPSDIPHIPTRKRGRPLGTTNKNKEIAKNTTTVTKVEPERGFCYVCVNQGQERRGRGQFEKLISCKDCTNKAHPSCVDFEKEAPHTSQWQCDQCKTCVVCIETIEKGSLVICCGCGEAYHLQCHDPKITDGTKKNQFVCAQCMPPPVKSSYDIDAPIDDRIPDVTNWTVDQVTKYLEEQGYPVQAAVFRDNDIDGASLLLMKRTDVLVGLNLKLGPALKIYGQVKKLQLRQSDPALLWP